MAAGKGVLICEDHGSALAAFDEMMAGKFKEAGKKIVVEQFLSGIEFSVFVVTDGENYQLLPVAKDYKRIGEGDTGLNTGGMGAISPVPFVDNALMDKVKQSIIEPTIRGIQGEGLDYRGFIFFGLINVNDKPYVIEYNCRLGDPETQVVLPRLKNDFVELMTYCHQGQVDQIKMDIDEQYAATVISVSGGYPEAYEKGKPIIGLEQVGGSAMVFHAGTKNVDDRMVTNGGRVLAVTNMDRSLQNALDGVYNQLEKFTFDGKYYRRDIGFDLK